MLPAWCSAPANDADQTRISVDGAAVDVLVAPTDEEIVIARSANSIDTTLH